MGAPDVGSYTTGPTGRGFKGPAAGPSNPSGAPPAPSGAPAPPAAQAAAAVAAAAQQNPSQVVFAKIVEKGTQKPVKGARCAVVDPNGTTVKEITTAFDGLVRADVTAPGSYQVKVIEIQA